MPSKQLTNGIAAMSTRYKIDAAPEILFKVQLRMQNHVAGEIKSNNATACPIIENVLTGKKIIEKNPGEFPRASTCIQHALVPTQFEPADKRAVPIQIAARSGDHIQRHSIRGSFRGPHVISFVS